METLLDRAAQARTRESLGYGSALYVEALALDRGPFLAGESLSDSLLEVRAALGNRVAAAREDLLSTRLLAASDSEAEGLLGQARALFASDPSRLARQGLLIRALRRAGYDDEANEIVSNSPTHGAPQLLARDDTSQELRRIRLVGRERELDDLVSMLSSRRVITITGPDGVGASSLAREALQYTGLLASADVIDLSEVTSQSDALATFARASATEPLGDPLVLEDVLRGLEGSTLLLDNVDVVSLGDMLRQVALRLDDRTIITTARRPLAMANEVVVPLAGLAAGEPGTASDQSRRAPGVELYLHRAADAGHPVPPHELSNVSELVRQLSGIPLYLEVAANHHDGGRPSRLLQRSPLEYLAEPRWDSGGRRRVATEVFAQSRSALSTTAQTLLHLAAELDANTPDLLLARALGEQPSSSAFDELVIGHFAFRPDGAVASLSLPPVVAEISRSDVSAEQRSNWRQSIRAALGELSRQMLTRPLAVPVSPEASDYVRALQSSVANALAWPDAWASDEEHALALLLMVDAELDRSSTQRIVDAMAAASNGALDPDLRFDLLRARLGFALASSDTAEVDRIVESDSELLPSVEPVRHAAWLIDSVFLALEDGRLADAEQQAHQAWNAATAAERTPAALTVRAARARMHAVRLHRGIEEGAAHALQAAALANLTDTTESISAWGEAAEVLVSAGSTDLAASLTRKAAKNALRWNSPHSLVYVLSLADIELSEGRIDECESILLLLLDRVWQRGDDRYQKWCLIRLALVAERVGDAKQAATLLGASSTISTAGGWDIDPDVNDLQERLPAILGGEAYREAFERGAAAPRGWIISLLDQPIELPTSLDADLLAALHL